jgi:NAD-dependent dihydropyrimidine dehydrogenase PreA subunit
MSEAHAIPLAIPSKPGLSTGKAILASLPMLLLTAFMLIGGRGGIPSQPSEAVPLLVTFAGVNVLFFLMAKTGKTDRYRAILFVTMAVTFVISFIANLLEVRGSMGLTEEDMLRGRTPFCHMVIPMTLVPAALTRTIIFPGALRGGFADISTMFTIWIGATLALGRGFCSWGCFFGGLEDGFSRLRRRTLVRTIASRWTYLPYAVLGGTVILSAVSLSPTYCEWLCPFKTVTEYVAVTNFRTALQAVIFVSLFFSLVVVLPILSRRRTQCGLFCPMGAFQGLFNKLNLFEVRIDRQKCNDCARCTRTCPTFSIDQASLAKGGTRLSCSKCGKCVDDCPKGAATFHIKGTPLRLGDKKARLLYLYPAFLFLVTFGSGMIQDAMRRVILFAGTGSLLR